MGLLPAGGLNIGGSAPGQMPSIGAASNNAWAPTVVGQDYTTTVWGSPIPISSGFRAVTGAVLWAGEPFKDDIKTTHTPPTDGFPGLDIQWSSWVVKRTFAVSFGKRLNPGDQPPNVRRVWADGSLIWSNGVGSPLQFGNVSREYIPTGEWVNGVWTPFPGEDASSFIPPSPLLSSNLTFRFYTGDEGQMPDPALADALGPLATAFRGLMYFVVDGLIVGKGSSNHIGATGVGGEGLIGPETESDTQFVLPTAFPSLVVELEDADAVTSSLHDFTMLASPPLFGGNHILLANYGTREIATMSSPDGSGTPGGYLHFFDMDSKTETSFTAITGGGSNIFGDGYLVWDHINDVFYTASSISGSGTVHPFAAVNRDGTVVGLGMDISANNPENVDNTTITDAKPAIRFPEPHIGDLTHAIDANALQPIMLAGFINNVAMTTPSPGGAVPANLYPRSILDISPLALTSMQALPLLNKGLADGRSYQDCAFLYAATETGIPTDPGEVHIVYVGLQDGPGGDPIAFVRHDATIYTATSPASNLHAMMDQNGNVLIQEVTSPAGVASLTRVAITYTPDTDFALVPGWNGIFPRVGAVSMDHQPSGENYVWTGFSTQQSDVSAGTLSIHSGQLLDLTTGTTVSNGLGAASSSNNIWDSQQKVRFFHGTLADSAYGNGMRYGQVWIGTDGGINTLAKYLRDFAHEAGFTDADIDIDTSLNDPVPGVLITHAYDLNQLYADIGVLYDFTFYNAGGKLRFRRSDNSPKKATGSISFSANPTAGETVTVGTQTYTFRAVPSAPFDVKLTTDSPEAVAAGVTDAKEKTCANLLAAIMADLGLAAADSLSDGFFVGTVQNAAATAQKVLSSTNIGGFTQIALTSIVGGLAANSVALSDTSGGISVSGAHLTGGAEAEEPIKTLDLTKLMHVNEQQLSDNDSLITVIQPLGVGQQAAAVNYYAIEQDYAYLQQVYRPDDQAGLSTLGEAQIVTYNLPFIISTNEAYLRVAKAQFAAGANVVSQAFCLPQAQLLLEPSDVISITIAPYRYTVRLDECTLNGDFSTSVTAINYTFRNDITVADSDSRSTLPQTVPTASDCLPVAIDAPILSPRGSTHAGSFDMFVGLRAFSTGFGQGQELFGALGQTAVTLLTTSFDVKWATLSGTVPDPIGDSFMQTIEDSITLVGKSLVAADLAAADDYVSFVGGQNCLVYGRPGNWEYIYFRDVEVLGAKTFKLTGLIRGQRGTEVFADTHEDSDVFLLIASASSSFTSGLRPQTLPITAVTETLVYYATGVPSSRAPTTVTITYAGLGLYPFAPGHLSATLAGGNDIDLAWVRRDRMAQEFVTNDQTLSETTELYDLEIMSGSTVVRTVNGLTTPSYTYTSAHQTTDGFTPPLATLKVRVYQVGELGRGFPRTETLNVS